MARNEEKAQAMLNRWWRMKRMLNQKPQEDRPVMVSTTNSIADCERWRTDIVREIGDKVSEIQNAGIGEYRIRNLNDEINRLLKEKRSWDKRIKELGGPDYTQLETKLFDRDGVELPGSGEYKYFGAAKDLPGVRELFFREAPIPPRRNRADLFKNIDYEYYGFLKGDNEEFLENELEYENYEKEKAIEEWIESNQELLKKTIKNYESLTHEQLIQKLKTQETYIVDMPSEPIHKFELAANNKTLELIELKKKQLLEKYVYQEGDDLHDVEELIMQNIEY